MKRKYPHFSGTEARTVNGLNVRKMQNINAPWLWPAFVLFLGYLAFHAGGNALKYLKQAKLSAGGIAGLKAALKGKDIVATTQDIINDLA